MGADFSHIYLWFVVNRVAYGESLRLFCCTMFNLKKCSMFWAFILIGAVFGLAMAFARIQTNSEEIDDQKRKTNRTFANIENFIPTKKIVGLKNFYIFAVDEKRKKVVYVKGLYKEIIPFDQIINIEFLEDSSVLMQKSSLRTVSGAVVGGAIAGGAGMIVGGLSGNTTQNKKISKIQVKVKLRDINHPSLVIDCFDCKTMTVEGNPIKPDSMEGYIYKQGVKDAQRIADTLSVIIDACDQEKSKVSPAKPLMINNIGIGSVADELTKLADLKERGFLTEDEFIAQKKVILGATSSETTSILPEQEKSTIECNMPPEVRDALAEGQDVLAIKLYMDSTGCSFEDAKKFIDSFS